MTYPRDERGIALVLEVVLVAAVLAAIGLAAYASMHAKKSDVVVKAASSSVPSPSTSPRPTPSLSPAADIFQIPELGIQMTLPTGLTKSDVYYVANTTEHTGYDLNGKAYHSLGSVTLSTHSLSAQQSYCTASATVASDGGLIAFEKTQEDVAVGYYGLASGNTNYEPVGNFWMSIADHQAQCSSDSNVTLENSQYQLFVQAFGTITPIQ